MGSGIAFLRRSREFVVISDDFVSPRLFRVIQGLVRLFHYRGLFVSRERGVVVFKGGDAYAYRNLRGRHRPVAVFEFREFPLYRHPELFGDGMGDFQIRPDKLDGEFLASDSADFPVHMTLLVIVVDVHFPQDFPQFPFERFRDNLKRLVSSRMPVSIVDTLEVVDIDSKNRFLRERILPEQCFGFGKKSPPAVDPGKQIRLDHGNVLPDHEAVFLEYDNVLQLRNDGSEILQYLVHGPADTFQGSYGTVASQEFHVADNLSLDHDRIDF